MSSFRFINRNVDVSKILQQVLDNPEDWKAVGTYENTGGNKNPYGFLPLVMGVIENPTDNIKNSELTCPTPMFDKYTEAIEWLKSQGFTKISRCAFFRLQPGGEVPNHIDDGTYYLSRDRYHLSLQGEYEYTCGDETHVITPGTFFWFDNKDYHTAKNISNVDRITLVFDVPHSPVNP